MAEPKARPWQVHPIWRGIGCVMMLVIPIMAYAGAVLLVGMNLERGWIPMSSDLLRIRTLPVVGLEVPRLYANLLAAGALVFIGYGIMMFFYALLYRAVEPRKGKILEAPPMHPSDRKRR
jgi:hypothetical protein